MVASLIMKLVLVYIVGIISLLIGCATSSLQHKLSQDREQTSGDTEAELFRWWKSSKIILFDNKIGVVGKTSIHASQSVVKGFLTSDASALLLLEKELTVYLEQFFFKELNLSSPSLSRLTTQILKEGSKILPYIDKRHYLNIAPDQIECYSLAFVSLTRLEMSFTQTLSRLVKTSPELSRLNLEEVWKGFVNSLS